MRLPYSLCDIQEESKSSVVLEIQIMNKTKSALEDTRGGRSCKSCESASVSHGQRDTTLLLDLPTSACLAEIVKKVADVVRHMYN